MELLFLVLSVFVVIKADKVPFPDKCDIADSKCLKQASIKAIPIIAAGLPEYEIKQLDPLFIKKINADSSSLKLQLKDITFRGLKGCKTRKLQIDRTTSKATIKLNCDVIFDGDYVMGGSLLVIPIEGEGKVHAELNQMYVNLDFDLGEEVKDNKRYLKLKSWKHTFDLKAKANVDFQNLFNGNPVLSRAARELIANNGNDIVKEIGPPAVKAIVSKVVQSVTQVFKHAAIDDLFV